MGTLYSSQLSKESEKKAKNFLQENGYNPIQVLFKKGIPDFKCSDNRFVEVKRFSNGWNHLLALPQSQFDGFKNLMSEGNTVLFMFFKHDNSKADMYKIEYIRTIEFPEKKKVK